MPGPSSVPCAVKFIREQGHRAWLVLGKGPTFANLRREHLTGRGVIALNHAAKEMAYRFGEVPFLAHFTDWEACLDCLPAFGDDAKVTLVLPWYPHSQCRVSKISLPQRLAGLVRTFPVCSYQSSLAGRLPSPAWLTRVRVRLFSAVAAVNLLAAAGVKQVHTLGVDGGTAYADMFDAKDRLANGQRSFDCQWAEIRSTLNRHSMGLVKES